MTGAGVQDQRKSLSAHPRVDGDAVFCPVKGNYFTGRRIGAQLRAIRRRRDREVEACQSAYTQQSADRGTGAPGFSQIVKSQLDFRQRCGPRTQTGTP
jgi:hypothetical protein